MNDDKKLLKEFINMLKDMVEAQRYTNKILAELKDEMKDLKQRIHSLWALVLDEGGEDIDIVIPFERDDRLGHMYN